MKPIPLTLLLAGSGACALANNIQLTNVSVSGQNTAANYSQINFDVAWDNSWRTTNNETNYDGAWVFMKFRKAGTSVWKHATLNYVSPGTAAGSGHTQPAGSTLQTPADGKGVWMYRDAPGIGNVVFTGASVRWNYGVDSVMDNDSVEVRVYGVEMVYVTEGQFSLGSNGTETGRFKLGSTNNPYLVTSESTAITVGAGATNLSYTTSTGAGDGTGSLAASFPKGYNDFWMMKYETSEQGYVDFLNTLDATRAANRLPSGIYGGAVYTYTSTVPERSAGTISIADHLAFLDWSALRPFTELEYEKASRGFNNTPIPDEYAWGNTTLSAVYGVTNPGTATERQVQGNAVYRINSPGFSSCGTLCRAIRNGAFANDTSDTRQETGASYYGIMELSGNVSEIVVSAGSTAGRAFTGLNGDGELTNIGEANTANWSSTGMGVRGGSFNSLNTEVLRTSDRSTAVVTTTTRNGEYGIRGARTAE